MDFRRRAVPSRTRLVGLAAVLGTAGLTACGGTGPWSAPAPAPAADSPLARLVAWSLTNLSATDAVSTADAEVGATLTAAGVSGVQVSDPTPGPGYVVTSGAASAPVALGATASLVPVAVFTGTAALTLSVVVALPVSDARAAVDAATVERVGAERALTTNPAVTTPPAVRAVLAAGGLDLRAAALVTVLGTTGPVEIVTIHGDPAERTAGGGARTIVLGGVTPATVSAVTAGTVGSFHPTITAVNGTGATGVTTTVQWPLTPFASDVS